MDKKVSNLYKFEKNRKRVRFCPCGKSNRNGKFAPYQGYEKYGYCHSCDSVFYPDNERSIVTIPNNLSSKKSRPSFIKTYLFEKSCTANNSNSFFQFLSMKFGRDRAARVFTTYKIGTSTRWPGATIFWQIDMNNKIRTGRIMSYNPMTGKRIKSRNDWVHSVLLRKGHLEEFNLEQCLFGLHLISNITSNISNPIPNDSKSTNNNIKFAPNTYSNKNVVAIVESEKTACIMSVVIPDMTWLASGGLGNLTYTKVRPLKNQTVILFPDLASDPQKSPFQIWSSKAEEFRRKGYYIYVSDLLELKATTQEKILKLDIADFFI